MKIGSLCSGYSGLEMGIQSVLGGEVAWHSEVDAGPNKVLAYRYPDVPNLGDMTAVDWRQVEPVDVICGGTPCQDVSAAGKRAGMRAGTRSGLWASMSDAIDVLRPSLVVWENVRGVLSAHADSAVEPCPICVGDERDAHLRALGRVVGDLAELGYVGRWTGLRAADVGAPHGRFRVFVVAWPNIIPHPRHAAAGPEHRRDMGDASHRSPCGLGQSSAGLDTPPPHPDGAACGERRLAAPGQAEGGRARADAGGRDRASAADADRDGLGRLKELHGVPQSGREEGSHRDHADGLALAAGGVDWGTYTAAVRRWERLTRPAPNPTERGKNGRPRLSPVFVEWLMGLADGWVTDVPGVTRNEALRMLGNGVVPQQAAAALRVMLAGEAVGSTPADGLLPTPSAGNFNDGESVEQWEARRERQRARGINGNGMGTPLAIAVQRTQDGAA